jgi:small-conductance mechanosensitive channel
MDFLDWKIFTVGDFTLRFSNVIGAALVIILARLFYVVLRRVFLVRYFKRRKIDEGRQFAIGQLIKYVIYIIAFLVAIEASGMNITVLYAAGAALLVGLGIGIQQTFNDFMSGVILLVEGSIKKGDWLLIGDMEGKVIRIGLRTSLIQTRRRIAVIVPNSKITVENVINLSHGNAFIRYEIAVGVAYGSDTRLVEKTLTACATRHPGVLKAPGPFVRLVEFGDSGIMFELHFWSNQFQRIVDIKSDLRFEVEKRLREEHIVIPFPQRDLHVYQAPPPKPPAPKTTPSAGSLFTGSMPAKEPGSELHPYKKDPGT